MPSYRPCMANNPDGIKAGAASRLPDGAASSHDVDRERLGSGGAREVEPPGLGVGLPCAAGLSIQLR
jgi:hypothetical protein